ncbi:hypothetical protein F441_15416 [Phytophthora nicotianae CJ01A1]|uniref:CBM1 domain-containing protein n=2 Tax=Phytophthora nicotianae TaxID=4792 RepID=W2WDR5_PHYNI|nr:hypothetical protein F444_15583 [Phytophthora nicotianae P1976]ETP08671.1 hypothetical protein F441_15416 [Phytophthora nicotianae CJ01A1]
MFKPSLILALTVAALVVLADAALAAVPLGGECDITVACEEGTYCDVHDDGTSICTALGQIGWLSVSYNNVP